MAVSIDLRAKTLEVPPSVPGLSVSQTIVLRSANWVRPDVLPLDWDVYPELEQDLDFLASSPANDLKAFPVPAQNARGLDVHPRFWIDWTWYDRADAILLRLHALNRWDVLIDVYPKLWDRAALHLAHPLVPGLFSKAELVPTLNPAKIEEHWRNQSRATRGELAPLPPWPGFENQGAITALESTFLDPAVLLDWLEVEQEGYGCGKEPPPWAWWFIPYGFGWWFQHRDLPELYQGPRLVDPKRPIKGCGSKLNDVLFAIALAASAGAISGVLLTELGTALGLPSDAKTLAALEDAGKAIGKAVATGGDLGEALIATLPLEALAMGLFDNLGLTGALDKVSDTLGGVAQTAEQIGGIKEQLDQIGNIFDSGFPAPGAPTANDLVAAEIASGSTGGQQSTLILIGLIGLAAWLVWRG